MEDNAKKKKSGLTIREICIFAMLGALMFALKKAMEGIPNIHFNAVLIVVYTIVYRRKALYPIYIYVFLDGVTQGFSQFWVPYLYLWTLLWAAVMLLPKKMPLWVSVIVYGVVCSLHGFLFGTLWAPYQALTYHYNLKQTLAWIATGFPFDCIQGAGNLVSGLTLVVPLSKALRLADRVSGREN